MRRLRKIGLALGRWWLRQAAALLVVGLGMVLGWCIRKATGPSLVSESFSRVRSSAPVPPRPGPLTPRDPVVAGFVAEFASLKRPSGTLLRLQADLEGGRITDFEVLAKSLLSHPLLHFREEAMHSLLTWWGRKDPGGALRFLEAYATDIVNPGGDRGTMEMKYRFASDWINQDPAGALDYFSQSPYQNPMAEQAVSTLAARQPGLSLSAWQSVVRKTRDPALAAKCAQTALLQKCGESPPPSSEELGTWLAEVAPSDVRRRIKWDYAASPRAFAVLLPSLSAQEVATAPFTLASVPHDQILAMVKERGSGWLPEGTIKRMGGSTVRSPDAAWSELVAALEEPGQRTDLALGLVKTALGRSDGSAVPPDSLPPLLARLQALGRDGEPALVTMLGGLPPGLASRAPELFGSLPSSFQQEHRMVVAAQLASRSSPAAAEIWLRASPDELAQPGAAAVSRRSRLVSFGVTLRKRPRGLDGCRPALDATAQSRA